LRAGLEKLVMRMDVKKARISSFHKQGDLIKGSLSRRDKDIEDSVWRRQRWKSEDAGRHAQGWALIEVALELWDVEVRVRQVEG
jgi:hypothetical protein